MGMDNLNGDLKSYDIKITNWQQDQANLRAIREQVFVVEQQVPIELEWDQEDQQADHFLVLVDQHVAGCARLTRQGQLGRMAILPAYRHQGLARALLQAIVQHATQTGFGSLYLHAQTYIEALYAEQGFIPEGEVFMEAGIPHRQMRCDLG